MALVRDVLIALVLSSAALCGQSVQSPTGAPLADDTVCLAEGHAIDLVLRHKLSSETAKAGDAVQSEVGEPVKIGDLVVIASGTPVKGEVVAARARGRKGAAGALAISFENVPAITGQTATIAGRYQKAGEDRSRQVWNDFGDATFGTLGFGAPLAPFILLRKGGSVDLDEGLRLPVFIGKELCLSRTVLETRQPAPALDRGTVYVIHGFYPTCGSEPLPFTFEQADITRIELPPGRYWFHAGVKFGARGIFAGVATGLTFGGASPAFATTKKVLQRPMDEFTMLQVKGGETYYLAQGYEPSTQVHEHLRLITREQAEKKMAEKIGRYYWLRGQSQETLKRLQAVPKTVRRQ